MQFSNSSSGTGVSTRGSGRVTRASELRAVKLDSAATALITGVSHHQHQQTAGVTPKAVPSSHMNGSESLLKPAKQAQSECGTMRTTRSKSKAKASDQGLSEQRPSEAAQASQSQISNR